MRELPPPKLKKLKPKKPKQGKKPGPDGVRTKTKRKPAPDAHKKKVGKKPSKPLRPRSRVGHVIDVTFAGRLENVIHAVAPFDQSNEFDLVLKNVSGSPATIHGCELLLTQGGGWVDGLSDLYAMNAPLAGRPKKLRPSESIRVTFPWTTGNGATHGVLRLRATGKKGRQHSFTPAPLSRAGYDEPAPVPATSSRFLGFYAQPMEIVRVWRGGKATHWVTVGGMLFNATGDEVRVHSASVEVRSGGSTLLKQPMPLRFRDWDYTTYEFGKKNLKPGADGSILLTAVPTPFIHGIELPNLSRNVQEAELHVSLSCTVAKHNVHEGGVVPLRRAQAVDVTSPVKGTWFWGSAADHVDFDAHTWPHQRFSVDLVRRVDGSVLKPNVDAKRAQNSDFHCYGETVYAMAAGTVISEDDANMEGSGYTPLAGGKVNYVMIQHADGVSGYYHLRQGKNLVSGGNSVAVGQAIGQVGNSAAAEPHLHIAFLSVDETGRGRLRPMAFTNLKTLQGTAVVGAPGTGEYKS